MDAKEVMVIAETVEGQLSLTSKEVLGRWTPDG